MSNTPQSVDALLSGNRAYIGEYSKSFSTSRTASVKPRADIEEVLTTRGFRRIPFAVPDNNGDDRGVVPKVARHFKAFMKWRKIANQVPEESLLVIQYPPFNNSYILYRVFNNLHKKRVKIVLWLHDVEALRLEGKRGLSRIKRISLSMSDSMMLQVADYLVAHNRKMSEALVNRFSALEANIISLELFDYLQRVEVAGLGCYEAEKDDPIVIAGSLAREKAGYIYSLPSDLRFNLFGVGVDCDQLSENVSYMGSHSPDSLPNVIKGSFGLVWDGPSADSCKGTYGQYLKINNPHKASLYLAAGLPLIVWEHSALAELVRSEKVGLIVSSLNQIRNEVDRLPEEEYRNMRKRSFAISKRVRSGYYANRVIDSLIGEHF